jgi:hypothetical protein
MENRRFRYCLRILEQHFPDCGGACVSHWKLNRRDAVQGDRGTAAAKGALVLVSRATSLR